MMPLKPLQQLSLDEALARSTRMGAYPPFEVAKSVSALIDALPVE